MNQRDRIYFLDNLRSIVILFVIILHASITYMAFPPSWWYVIDTNNSVFFTLLVLLIDVPIMLILFFLAGFFALPSLIKRGTTAFLKDKVVRIGIPWVIGVLILAPPTAYLTYYSRGVPMSLGEFWATEFWGPMYQQSVYWFLGILLVMFAFLALLFSTDDQFKSIKPKVELPSWKMFTGFVALMTAGFLLINLVYPLDTWMPISFILMVQPLRTPLYIGYFSLGIYAYRKQWFSKDGYKPELAPWVLLCLFSGLSYLAYRFGIPVESQTNVFLKAGNAILFNGFCFSTMMAGLAVFQRKLNHTSMFWRSQAENSYGIYYLHPLILYPLALLFVTMPIPIIFKAFSIILLTILISWGISMFILRRAPFLREAF